MPSFMQCWRLRNKAAQIEPMSEEAVASFEEKLAEADGEPEDDTADAVPVCTRLAQIQPNPI